MVSEVHSKGKLKRTYIGKVISSKMEKTITVLIERKVKHPLYGKYMRKSTKLHAHDPNNECNEGETVVIEEHRPISKTKSWHFVKVIEKVKVA